jgi:hypothetical protein
MLHSLFLLYKVNGNLLIKQFAKILFF